MRAHIYPALVAFLLAACGGTGAANDGDASAGSGDGSGDAADDGDDGDGGQDGGQVACGDDVSPPSACTLSDALIPVAGAPWGVGAGDVDGDGIVDLVVGHSVELKLSVIRGIGAGGFEQPVVVDVDERSTGSSSPTSMGTGWTTS